MAQGFKKKSSVDDNVLTIYFEDLILEQERIQN